MKACKFQLIGPRSQHGQDEGPDKGLMPDVVVFPQTTEEVSEVKKI
jgi:FAD/FMN-containing dehydrogenase